MSFHELAVAINALPKGTPVTHIEDGRTVVIPRGWGGDQTEAFFFEVAAGPYPNSMLSYGEKRPAGRFYTVFGINTGVGCREPYTAFKTRKEALAYAIAEAKSL